MKTTSKLLGASASIALVALTTAPAYATTGTTAGTQITNTVTVNYKVGGVDQVQEEASNTFTVDRVIDFVITEVGSTQTSVSPGETQAVTVFQATNNSNTAIDIGLSATQQSGGASAFLGGTDTFDSTNTKIYIDVNGDGLLDAGDQLVTYIDELAAGATVQLLVVSDIPVTQTNGDIATVILTGTAKEAGTANTEGAIITQTAGADDANNMDTVFADGAGAIDSSRDGVFSARDDYAVLAAQFDVFKLSRIVSDPINGTNDPKAIPGATVEYCIAVTNAADGAEATNVIITDVVPGDLTYSSTFGVKVGGSYDGSSCTAGSDTGSFDGTTVSGEITSLPSPGNSTLVFQATIN